MAENIEWYCEEDEFKPATDQDIKDVEEYLNIGFPDDFRKEIKNCHGCSPRPDCIFIKGGKKK